MNKLNDIESCIKNLCDDVLNTFKIHKEFNGKYHYHGNLIVEKDTKYFKEIGLSIKEIDILENLGAINVIDSKKEKCCLCGKALVWEHGNNPWPIKKEGKCCDQCNQLFVLPKRLSLEKSK